MSLRGISPASGLLAEYHLSDEPSAFNSRQQAAASMSVPTSQPSDPFETPPSVSDDAVGMFSDVYHQLLTASWPMLLLSIVGAFTILNALFAIAYMIGGGIENARPGSFADVFFFSVQTMATIGYGRLVPSTAFANLLTVIEAMGSVLGLAVVTGLVFAKFSRPTAYIRFTRYAVVSIREGVPSVMFRMANIRGNRIVEATAHVVFARQEHTNEGEEVRRFYDLELTRYRNVIFNFSWTAIHPISASSPFYGQDADSLEKSEMELTVSVTGFDESFAQTVHARHSYSPHDIIWGARLADILVPTPEGRKIDYSRYDAIEPAAAIADHQE